MATFKEACEALDYLRGRIDAGSMAGERLAVIEAYFKEMLAAAHKLTGTTPTMGIVDEATEQDRIERRAPHITMSMSGDLVIRPKPYNTSTALTTEACANCIEQGIIQPGCKHD